jgi:hypothetical protein
MVYCSSVAFCQELKSAMDGCRAIAHSLGRSQGTAGQIRFKRENIRYKTIKTDQAALAARRRFPQCSNFPGRSSVLRHEQLAHSAGIAR